jgi:hypothetical protein
MNEFWVVYDQASGEELYRGSGAPGTSAYQMLPDGAALITVSMAVVRSPVLDLAALRVDLSTRIDAEAERVRALFVTALPAQIGTYVLKEAAARAWLADNSAPTVMLQPEATARGMTLEALAAEVISNADSWAFLSGAIEGLRFDAKSKLAAATTVGAAAQAAAIDWSTIGQVHA